MKISSLILFTAFLFLFACKYHNHDSTFSSPNVILFYLDDMGYGVLSLTGATGYTTLNLDNMVRKGIFFTNYYSPQAVCSASRAGLLTGCYSNRIGITGALSHRSNTGISNDEVTIAEVLKKKGYATAIYGKWHLGFQQQFLPTNHGFDEFYGIPYYNDMWPLHPREPGAYTNLPFFENEEIVNTVLSPQNQSQFTTQFTERTIQFIKLNQNQPFFVYLAHPMPHVSLYVSDKFKGKSQQGLFGDVMMEIDWGVGQIMQTLNKTGLIENTLVFFTSDNGPWLNYGNHAGIPVVSGKEKLLLNYEDGQRVPCLMKWRGVIADG